MDTFKRVPSPNLTDFETVVCRQEPGAKNEAILVPKSESELASKFGAKKFDFGGNHSKPTANDAYGVGPSLWPQSVERDNTLHDFEGAEADPRIHHLKHVTDQDVAATPLSGKPDHTPKSSKEKRSSSGRYVTACATLALTVGVAAGVLASKLMFSSNMAMPEQQVIVNQLNVIAQELSSLHQSMEELAARQQNVAEAQRTLAREQARLAAAQEQETLKQDHVTSGRVNRSSRNRR
jgi:uncharacterized membrane-anchored protein YhcB (DUF1043 family)